ncbi:MAG: hypothetical protein ACYC26_01440 [Phycisphaerales bacterium]
MFNVQCAMGNVLRSGQAVRRCFTSHIAHRTLQIALLVSLASLGGCEAAGFVAEAVAGGEAPPIQVTAEYKGLEGKSVAVVVNADLPMLYQFPQVQLEVGTAVSRAIAADVPGVSVVDPKQVVEFQTRNIYWNTVPYGQLMKKLGVQRLVFVEMVEYRTHEPGNQAMYRGVAAARIDVAEADGKNPDNVVYSTVANVAYPPNEPEGIPDANELTIRKGMLDLFARAVAGRFHDHEEARPKSKGK